MSYQLPLDFEFNNELTFDSFVTGGNAEAVDVLQRLTMELTEPYVYLWGGAATGKSHLLQAVCQSFASLQKPAAMIPLAQHQQLAPEILDGLEQLSLVCIDDIDCIAGLAEWEEALFHFFNRMRDSANKLLISGGASPAQQTLRLNDLKSRLAWGLVLQLRSLEDGQKVEALRKRALIRGMELNDEVGQFLLARYSRDMVSLMNLLDVLDEASLREQRRLTVPFVRQYLQ